MNYDDMLLLEADRHAEDREEPTKVWLLISDKKAVDYSTDNSEELTDMKPLLDPGFYEIGWIWITDYNQNDFARTYRLFNPIDIFKVAE